MHTLQDHLVECETRYQGVVERLDTIDVKLDRVEKLVLEIKQAISTRDYKNP